VRSPVAALIAVPGTEAAVELMIALRPRALAIELLYRESLELVCAHRRLALPLHTEHDVFVLTEVPSLGDLAAIAYDDVAIAEDADRRAALWAYRDLANEAIAAQGVPHKLDVTVPLGEIAAFVAALPAAVQPHRLILFGHLGDGNLHVNVLGPPPGDESVDEAVLRLVARHRGSISAEHGVGVAKRKWLGLTRGQAEIDAMRAITRALDPNGILNPGVILEGSSKHGRSG
jgi:FAD/FMN-containing dehydrogenase